MRHAVPHQLTPMQYNQEGTINMHATGRPRDPWKTPSCCCLLHLRRVLASVRDEGRAIEARIAALGRDLRTVAAADPVVRRLREVPRHCALDRDGPRRDRGAYRGLPPNSSVYQLVGTHPVRALQ